MEKRHCEQPQQFQSSLPRQLSRLGLLNNIGVLLATHHENSHTDAIQRFQAVIIESNPPIKKTKKSAWDLHVNEPDYQGLSWFYRKLQRDSTPPPLLPTRIKDASLLGLEYYDETILATSHNSPSEIKAMSLLNWSIISPHHHHQQQQQQQELLEKARDLLLQSTTNHTHHHLLFSIIYNNLAVLQFHSNINHGWSSLQQAHSHYTQYKQQPSSNHNIDDSMLQIILWCNMARYAVRRNDIPTTKQYCQQILEYSPPSSNHNNKRKMKWIIQVIVKYYIMGMAYQRCDKLEKALECYNSFLQKARKVYGHDSIIVGIVLQFKGSVLFEQRNLTSAMLAFLASLKIQEREYSSTTTYNKNDATSRMERLLYQIARTLHDKEDYTDALHMYERTLTLQQRGTSQVQLLTTMCNMSRVHYLLGHVDISIQMNEEMIQMAMQLSGPTHPFVAHRLKVLGNLFVEMGRLDDAMAVFAKAARCGLPDAITNFYDQNSQDDDNDISPFAIQAAKTLTQVGILYPHAACA